MTEEEARAVLGISETATIKEARKAHRDRAKVFHPDRHAGGTPEDITRATGTMARINLALDTLTELDAAGQLGGPHRRAGSSTSRTSSFAFTPRSATAQECFLCGATPAAEATLRGYAGVLIWISSHTFTGSFCRSCGHMLFRESQVLNLTRGWWGIVIVPMLWAVIANMFTWLRLRRLGEPAYRDPSVVTPLEMPAGEGRPVAARPSVWLASVVAIAILAGLAGASLTPANNRPSGTTPNAPGVGVPPTSIDDLGQDIRDEWIQSQRFNVGQCWSSPDASGMIQPVLCTASNARFVIAEVATNEASCPSDATGTVVTDDNRYACLRELK